MRTGEFLKCIHLDGSETFEEEIFCDICGWGDCIVKSTDKYDFCHRHKDTEIENWIEKKEHEPELFRENSKDVK